MEKNSLPRPQDKQAEEFLPDDWQTDDRRPVETGLIMKAAEEELPDAFKRRPDKE